MLQVFHCVTPQVIVTFILATIISHLNWYTPSIVESLVFALPHDSEKWNWSIDTALQRFVSPAAIDVKPEEPEFFAQVSF